MTHDQLQQRDPIRAFMHIEMQRHHPVDLYKKSLIILYYSALGWIAYYLISLQARGLHVHCMCILYMCIAFHVRKVFQVNAIYEAAATSGETLRGSKSTIWLSKAWWGFIHLPIFFSWSIRSEGFEAILHSKMDSEALQNPWAGWAAEPQVSAFICGVPDVAESRGQLMKWWELTFPHIYIYMFIYIYLHLYISVFMCSNICIHGLWICKCNSYRRKFK